MRNLGALCLVLSIAFACNKDKPGGEKPGAAATAESQPAAKAKPGDEGAPTGKPGKQADKPAPPKKQPAKKAEKDKLAAYWSAMNDGRKATLAKKYDDAYAAFDKALVAMPDDARAYSERGYAKLLAKDYKGAVADLDRAVARTSDAKLLGQIYYNYGLAAEGQGDAEAARAFFARSNAYNPTPAAKKKLDGKNVCTAIIDHKQPANDSKTFASWKAAYDDARSEHAYLDAWSSEDVSLKNLCSNPWKKGAACVAKLGDVVALDGRLYVPTPEGKVVLFYLDLVGGRCGGDIDAKLVTDEGDVTHVSWKAMQGIPVIVTEKNGEMVPCGEKDLECTTACGDDAITYADLFVAKDKGESMLFVSRASEDGKDPLKVTVEMPVVNIKGKGCDAERPLAK